jgi:hypothetical protein
MHGPEDSLIRGCRGLMDGAVDEYVGLVGEIWCQSTTNQETVVLLALELLVFLGFRDKMFKVGEQRHL